jgi:hypothetical protein
VQLDEPFGEREAEPGAFARLRGLVAGLLELLEDPLLIFRRDADPSVVHRQADLVTLL